VVGNTRLTYNILNSIYKQAVCVKAKPPAAHVYQRRTWDELKTVFIVAPSKSTSTANRELGIPQRTVWRVLRRRLLFKTERLTEWVSLFEWRCLLLLLQENTSVRSLSRWTTPNLTTFFKIKLNEPITVSGLRWNATARMLGLLVRTPQEACTSVCWECFV
jgi:hypothetical protein